MATPPPNRTPSKHPRQPSGVPVSSQRYLDIAQVRDGVVVLRDGSLRAVILVNAVNFALKSEEEQNALIYAYQGFLNSFNFPIQIVMQSRQLDLVHYLKKLSDQLAESTNELVQLQIADYIQFIERLIQIANIMDKKFYVTVPFTPPSISQRGWFDKLFNPGNRLEVRMSPAEFKSYRQELLERARIIMGGLSGMGLRSAMLGTQETIELLYATYNPEEATKERLSEVGNITGAYVHPPVTDGANGNQQTANGNIQPIQPATPAETTNPLATVVPEAGIGNQQTAISDQPEETVSAVILSDTKDLAPTTDQDASAEPQHDNLVPISGSNQPIADSRLPIATDLTLPEPLGPTAVAPIEGPDAGKPAVAISDQQSAISANQSQNSGDEIQNSGAAAATPQTPASSLQPPVQRAPVLPTTGFGQPVPQPVNSVPPHNS